MVSFNKVPVKTWPEAPLPATPSQAPRRSETVGPLESQTRPHALRGSKSSDLLNKLRSSKSRQTLHEGAGMQSFRIYQQWHKEVEEEYGLSAWHSARQNLAAGIVPEIKTLIEESLLPRLQDPEGGVTGNQIALKNLADRLKHFPHADGESLANLLILTGSLKQYFGENVLQALSPQVQEDLKSTELAEEALEGLSGNFEMQLIKEDGKCAGTLDGGLRKSLLLRDAGRYIVAHQQADGTLPALEDVQAWVEQRDQAVTGVATNGEWLAALPEKVFEECRPLLKKRDETSKRWFNTEESPAFHKAAAHLQFLVENGVSPILRTNIPNREENAQHFDKEVHDQMSLWVATAWALPGVLGKWKAYQEALNKAKQPNAAQADLPPKVANYVAAMRDACEGRLQQLRGRDGTIDPDNAVLVKAVDEKLKEKLLQKEVAAKVTGAWHDGMPEEEARELMEDVEKTATSYKGTINIPLRERLLEQKMVEFARERLKEPAGEFPPPDIESRVSQMYLDATKEATDPWISKITDQLISECLAECKRQIRHPEKDATTSTSLRSYPKYNMKNVEDKLKQSVRAEADDILRKLREEGFSPAEERTWVEFNFRFGQLRKLKIAGALVPDGYRTPGLWWKAVEETAKRRKKPILVVAGPVLLHAAGKSLKKAMETMSERMGPGEQEEIRNFKKNLPEEDRKVWEEIFESQQRPMTAEETDAMIAKMEKRFSTDTKKKIMRLSAFVSPPPEIEE